MSKSDDICAAVIDDLTFDPDVDASDIRVEEMEGVEATAKDGDITLTGSVRTGTEREAAEVMVAELTGVAASGTKFRSLTCSSLERLARDHEPIARHCPASTTARLSTRRGPFVAYAKTRKSRDSIPVPRQARFRCRKHNYQSLHR
jgi:BON domain